MDLLLGIPSMLRDPNDARRNHTSGYGTPADFRLTEHTFEYRTAGGFNLHHPWLTRSFLEHGLLFFNDLMSRAFVHTKGWTNMAKFNSYEHMSEAYGLPDYALVKTALVSNKRVFAERLLDISKDVMSSIYGVKPESHSFRTLFDSDCYAEYTEGETLTNWS
jgi:hypothetical protein